MNKAASELDAVSERRTQLLGRDGGMSPLPFSIIIPARVLGGGGGGQAGLGCNDANLFPRLVLNGQAARSTLSSPSILKCFSTYASDLSTTVRVD